jgi:hypothetical protein
MLPTKTNFMKEIPAMRGILMMALMLVSMSFVFKTVMDSFKDQKVEEEKEAGQDLEAYNKLLEQFEIVTPVEGEEQSPPGPAGAKETTTGAIAQMEKERKDKQDATDRQKATEALMESIGNGEANRLLEAIAKPLVEKEDIRMDEAPRLPETLPLSVESLLAAPEKENAPAPQEN